MNDASKFRAEILTGQFHTASVSDQQMIRSLFGEHTEQKFELYFHWYNLIHELGHAVMDFNAPKRPHPAEEEQLVNDFATAFWNTYGEAEKFDRLSQVVLQIQSRFPCLVTDGSDHVTYAKSIWGSERLMTFEIYGWFQFSCVAHSLANIRTLPEVLESMGISVPGIPKEKMILCETEKEEPEKIIRKAVKILKEAGLSLPQQIDVRLVEDPNCHMLRTYPM